jgi:predicted ATP-dependent endonuclease of OLD family
MKLQKFRVTNFRSVADSGWVEIGDITALIGTNEAGKTNLLLPLWKLNPAGEGGEINAIADYPRKLYGEFRDTPVKPVFIEAEFSLEDSIIQKLKEITGFPEDQLDTVIIKKDFTGHFFVSFPKESASSTELNENIGKALKTAIDTFNNVQTTIKMEETFKENVIKESSSALEMILDKSDKNVDISNLQAVISKLESIDQSKASRNSMIVPRLNELINELKEIDKRISKPLPSSLQSACDFICEKMPMFVYYSYYGNLDSEIYLPHVIENLDRTNLGQKEQAKVRTLKVLFKFVGLQPKEILELGIDTSKHEVSDEEIKRVTEQKKERMILLQSAGSKLTFEFRDWWKQGDYQFHFNADGNIFTITVTDSVRPEPIELELRSSGLQWFLSFYLVFLVENKGEYENTILLLDEPGLSLHPLAQKDLSKFFENLAETNQLLYTSHSPFMVDSNHLDRVKSVYIDKDGTTKVSQDLRIREKNNTSQARSIQAVYAALGLTVSDILLQGCIVVFVEGPSDQFYFSAIKNYLIGNGLIKPLKDIVFIAAGGVKGINATIPIVTGINDDLPFVILDSDQQGRTLASNLKGQSYSGCKERIISVSDYVTFQNAEIEDLLPFELISKVAAKILFRSDDDDFLEGLVHNVPFVSQVETFASSKGIELSEGWKVELSRAVKVKMLRDVDQVKADSDDVKRWQQIFQVILG